ERNGKKYVQKHLLKEWTFTLVEKHQDE
ncbi:hypothetical protein MOB05_20695, partial [Bacillus spizizenii]|nr:hypothetical protein [Bacillus spizizenii]